MGTTRSEGVVHIGLGETIRKKKWGRDRKYVVAFLSSGGPQKPLAEFLAADDYKEKRELVAVIRGSDGGRRMYGPGDALPEIYEEHFRTQMYDDRVDYAGVWHKVVVGRARGRPRDDAQPRVDPGPAARLGIAGARESAAQSGAGPRAAVAAAARHPVLGVGTRIAAFVANCSRIIARARLSGGRG